MRKPIEKLSLVWIAVIGLAAPACAEVPGASPKTQAGERMGGMGHIMMSEEQMEQRARMMQDHMLQMHELMGKIEAATDPAEKEKLKQQQRDIIKQHMRVMLRMHPGGGIGHPGGD